MNSVMRVALVDTKSKKFLEYLVDTDNYKTAEEVAKAEAVKDGYDLEVYSMIAVAQLPILKGA
ncbi:hypothetical protein KKJFFJLC_00031 [Vibrio phage vB_VpaS_PGB]|nr:hypothetical protein HHKILHMN_00003 [Vibrio phage vB_VpaS_PGA]WVH05574.1 hypothetical protein KKJFFJLC_00031 [Vibrio phage vB_VpaS_PGB]